jgi:hypothetical protein
LGSRSPAEARGLVEKLEIHDNFACRVPSGLNAKAWSKSSGKG